MHINIFIQYIHHRGVSLFLNNTGLAQTDECHGPRMRTGSPPLSSPFLSPLPSLPLPVPAPLPSTLASHSPPCSRAGVILALRQSLLSGGCQSLTSMTSHQPPALHDRPMKMPRNDMNHKSNDYSVSPLIERFCFVNFFYFCEEEKHVQGISYRHHRQICALYRQSLGGLYSDTPR